MPTIVINSQDYDSYSSVADADVYLGADFSRSASWGALTSDLKGRALITATRLLQRQSWLDGVPDVEAPPLAVAQATALLAADISLKPATGDSGSTSSNIKSVGAGSAKVEFFRPTAGKPLPDAAFELLRGLLAAGSSEDMSLEGTAYGSDDCQVSRFDYTDYALWNERGAGL